MVCSPLVSSALFTLQPGTARLHTIVDTTAKFVQQQGEQAEVRLRLQHKDNPSFSFLFIDDPLHPYYKFVRTLISEGVETAIPPPPPPPPAAAPEALAPLAPAPVVVPPQEQKAIIDKLVEMVQRHGLALENTGALSATAFYSNTNLFVL